MNRYEEKQEARRQRLNDRADRLQSESSRNYQEAREMGDRIPLGQPILVGHHSEKRDRNNRDRMGAKYDRSMEQRQQAEETRRRAEAVGTGGISSDDPEAVAKLRDKVERAKRWQEHMKAANKAVRLKDTAKGDRQLAELGYGPAEIAKLRAPDFMGRIGYPGFELTNNGANIRRMEQRVEKLERLAGDETSTETVGGIEIVDNVEENRVQIAFPGKPAAEIRTLLKSWGFRWARSLGVWQRHRSGAALHQAREIAGKAAGAAAE